MAIGGGHGLAATLRAVRTYTDRVTAIVSVADDGGSSGRLRELLHIIPPGDLRKCLVALAEPGSLLASAFEYRFGEEELAGHSLGQPDPGRADRRRRRPGGRPRRGLPPARGAGPGAAGHHRAGGAEGPSRRRPGGRPGGGDGHRPHPPTVSLVPADPTAPAEAVEALAEADQIVLGPGSLFTSVLAAVAVPEIREGIKRSGARKVYVCNLRPQDPETEGFDVAMHVEALVAHGVSVESCVCDTLGHGPRERPGCRWWTSPWPGPTGWPTIPAKLASALSDLLG